MAELNELLEQAAAEAGELSEEAENTSEVMTQITERATDLVEQVTSKGEEVRQHLRALKDKLAHAEGGVTDARGRADSSLEGLGARASAVREEVGELLEKVKAGLAELETQKARLQDSADTQAQAAEGAFSDLSDHVGDVADAIDQQLVTAHDAITAFRSAVETARTEFTAKKTEWDQAMEKLEEQATEQSLNWADGIHGLLADQATAVVDMTNHLVEVHNTAMEDLKEKFAQEAKAAVANSLQSLREELVPPSGIVARATPPPTSRTS
jgi:DNA repair exonuclease SbcCD ATPase subunit